jgi:hypothetical protein
VCVCVCAQITLFPFGKEFDVALSMAEFGVLSAAESLCFQFVESAEAATHVGLTTQITTEEQLFECIELMGNNLLDVVSAMYVRATVPVGLLSPAVQERIDQRNMRATEAAAQAEAAVQEQPQEQSQESIEEATVPAQESAATESVNTNVVDVDLVIAGTTYIVKYDLYESALLPTAAGICTNVVRPLDPAMKTVDCIMAIVNVMVQSLQPQIRERFGEDSTFALQNGKLSEEMMATIQAEMNAGADANTQQQAQQAQSESVEEAVVKQEEDEFRTEWSEPPTQDDNGPAEGVVEEIVHEDAVEPVAATVESVVVEEAVVATENDPVEELSLESASSEIESSETETATVEESGHREEENVVEPTDNEVAIEDQEEPAPVVDSVDASAEVEQVPEDAEVEPVVVEEAVLEEPVATSDDAGTDSVAVEQGEPEPVVSSSELDQVVSEGQEATEVAAEETEEPEESMVVEAVDEVADTVSVVDAEQQEEVAPSEEAAASAEEDDVSNDDVEAVDDEVIAAAGDESAIPESSDEPVEAHQESEVVEPSSIDEAAAEVPEIERSSEDLVNVDESVEDATAAVEEDHAAVVDEALEVVDAVLVESSDVDGSATDSTETVEAAEDEPVESQEQQVDEPESAREEGLAHDNVTEEAVVDMKESQQESAEAVQASAAVDVAETTTTEPEPQQRAADAAVVEEQDNSSAPLEIDEENNGVAEPVSAIVDAELQTAGAEETTALPQEDIDAQDVEEAETDIPFHTIDTTVDVEPVDVDVDVVGNVESEPQAEEAAPQETVIAEDPEPIAEAVVEEAEDSGEFYEDFA